MKQYLSFRWIAVMVVLVVSVSGCSYFERQERVAPTAPGGDASMIANFGYVGAGNGSKFGIYKQRGELMVDVLQGKYMLTYTTLLGTFHIVFESTQAAVFAIGLSEGDDVVDAYLQKGDIASTATSVHTTGPLIVYAFPGSVWNTIFVANPVTPIVTLVQNGTGIETPDVQLLPGTNDANFSVGVSSTDGGFSLFLPGGDYSIEFTTTVGGPYQFVFRVTGTEGLLTIPLLQPGAKLVGLTLQRGIIPFTAVVLQDAGDGVLFYFMPGRPIIIGNVFLVNPNFTILFLVINGVINVELKEVTEIKQWYTISTLAGPGGYITPGGATAPANASRKFKIVPEKGFGIDEVLLDGGPVEVKILGNGEGHVVIHHIQRDHNLTATFKLK